MLANQVLQKVINDIYEIIETDCSIWDEKGVRLAYAGELREKSDGISFAVTDEDEPVYEVVFHTTDTQLEKIGRLCVSQLQHLMTAYRARLDKNHFYQNLLLDNMLFVDIYNQAKKLGIDIEQDRIVYVIEPKHEEDELVLETLRGIYHTGTKDFVTSVDEGHIIYIKCVEKTESYDELNAVAKSIVTTLNTEAMVDVRVSYGTIVSELKDVSRSYKEAGMALDVGRVFCVEKNVLAYNELGIGRLIHQLPTSLCEMFLEEVLAGNAAEQLDDETLATVNRFFADNLNISETARHLYIHRNTLVYRLEKIQKITGLDVRVFEDALTFKIALMVSTHLKAMKKS